MEWVLSFGLHFIHFSFSLASHHSFAHSENLHSALWYISGKIVAKNRRRESDRDHEVEKCVVFIAKAPNDIWHTENYSFLFVLMLKCSYVRHIIGTFQFQSVLTLAHTFQVDIFQYITAANCILSWPICWLCSTMNQQS